ncbi:MAG: hypothetical protein GIW99_01595 [Candidatus Eremiobacteraeota bacterium]|nr:hypothetical protein [Candidatus Eremiobacteraeota bacterium]MBC5826376.1 hypothetical protein [Candidatus Eremiobacteraeota bacterium]
MDHATEHRFQEVLTLRDTLITLLTNGACKDEASRGFALQSLHAHLPADDRALFQKVHNRLGESAADILRPLMVDAANSVLLPAENEEETPSKRAAADFLERASLAVLGDD